VDASGAAYVTGYTWSPEFPTTSGAFDPTFNGSADTLITKLDLVPNPIMPTPTPPSPTPTLTGTPLATAAVTPYGIYLPLILRQP